MTTFSVLQKSATSPVSTFIDSAIPAGHFAAVTKVAGQVTTYLLERKSLTDVADAVIKGRVVIKEYKDNSIPVSYKKGGLAGGAYMGRIQSYADAFAKMV